jgi:hypothetical protein
MRYALGKNPARAGAVGFKFGTFFSAPGLPAPPLVFGRTFLVSDWQMLGNDSVGDCVWADAAHQTMYWRRLAGTQVAFDDSVVLADYSACTGYTPGNPATDQGTDLQQAASYRRKIGIADVAGTRHRTDAYVALTVGDLDEITLATYTLWAVSLGIQLPTSAYDQFDRGEVWTPVAGSPVEGGHCVPVVGRNSRGEFLIVTWGRLHAAAASFISTYMDEGIAHLSLEQMRADGVSPRGFDENGLRQALGKL